jgi:hypothetical protein
MTTEVAIYQTLSPDNAALAMRAEERIKARTVVTVIENGRDLLEVRNALGQAILRSGWSKPSRSPIVPPNGG